MGDNGNTIFRILKSGSISKINKKDGKESISKLPDFVIQNIQNQKNKIYADSQNGLWIYSKTASVFYKKNNTTDWQKITLNSSVNSQNDVIFDIKDDANGKVWIGTDHQGIFVYNTTNNNISNLVYNPNSNSSIASNNIGCLYKDDTGTIWAGHNKKGISYYNDSFGNLVNIELENCKDVSNFLEDKKGMIWAGTISSGLVSYDPKTGEVKTYLNDPAVANSLSDNFVNALFLDHEDNLWVTTENGLNRYNGKDRNFTRFTTSDGLPSNVTYRIEEDNAHNLWISTSRGLTSFNPKNAKVKTYTKSQGLLSDQFNYNSSFKDDAGVMYFGSVNGMIGFNPDRFIKNRVVPEVYITGFQVFNQELMIGKKGSPLKKSIAYTDHIMLDYDQSTFSIDFAALVYTDSESGEYAYKLEGLDKDYTLIKGNRRVFYTKLAPGKYTFMVRAANSSGVWTNEPRKLIIE
ncbi:MAG: hypothetical protein EOO44_00390, partial [Flavobacterium sp.]